MRRTDLMRLGCLGLLFGFTPPDPGAGPDRDGLLQGSYRLEQGGWIFVHLEGTPERVGFQHGYRLADEIADLVRAVKPYVTHNTRRDWAFFRHAAETMLWRGIDPEYRRELDGIVAGLKARNIEVDRWDIVALNSLEELPDYYVPWLDKQEGKEAITHAPGNCSAFVATGSYTRDGRIVMGHNNWTNYVTGPRWNIIFDLRPEHGHRILMDGLPGIITSNDDFAINDAGLLVTETTITGFFGYDPEGKPEFVRARKAIQYGASIDDFVRTMLDGNNGGYANDWLLGDTKTGEIARFELGLKNHRLERTRDGCFVGANFPLDPKLIAEETHFDPGNEESSPNARRARWEQLVSKWKGKIDIEAAKAFVTDVFDVIEGEHEASERTLSGRVESSPRGCPEWDWEPYFPGGTAQNKVVDAALAERMSFWAALGHHGAPNFRVEPFLEEHPEYSWMRGLLKDLRARPWSCFRAGMEPGR